MNSIISWSISRSRMVIALFVLFVVGGWMSYQLMPKEAAPDINIPIIYVSVSFEGISPEDAERLLVRPIEQQVRTIEGVKEMRATAYQGGANVSLEFVAGFDADKALDDVRQKVDIARPELPDGVEEPSVNEVNFSLFPVIIVTLSGDVPERTLVRLARELEDRVEALPEVLEVDISGDREEQVEIIIDPMLLESYGINPNDVIALFQRSNRLVAAGNLDTGAGRFAVKVPGLFETVEDIWNMPVKVNGDSVVLFKDVAEIRRTFKDPNSLARVNGDRAVALEVTKRTGENIIDTIAKVRSIVSEEQARWPSAVHVSYSQDQSDEIRVMVSDLTNNLISAALLVMVVCIAALGVRTGLLVGVAIPGSFLMGLLVLWIMGSSINNIVLFSLIMVVGMLVDGAIITNEYADRKMTEGLPPREAYALAAQRMAWPIISSTLTTVAAFAPLLFWPGVVGEFMKFLPITLIATLSASVLMALLFIPTLGGVFGRAGAADPALMKALAASESGDLRDLRGSTGMYVRILDRALNHPGKIVFTAICLLIGVWALHMAEGHGTEFFPESEPRVASVMVHARGNMSIQEKDALIRDVEERILPFSDEFQSVYTRVIGQSTGGGMGEQAEDVIGRVDIQFKEWDERRRADVILADIAEATSDLAGIIIETRKQEDGPGSGKPIQIELAAMNPDQLPVAVAHVRRGLEEIGGFVGVEDTRPLPGIDWEVKVDRAQAAKFGVDVSAVGDAIRLVTNGLILAEYRPDDTDDEVDIVARYPAEYRSIEQLDKVRLPTDQGAIPVGNFVIREPQPKIGMINRVEARRVMEVKADVPPGALADTKLHEIQAWLGENPLPQGVQVTYKGENEEQEESSAFLSKAFAVALFLIAVILIAQFNSFYSTFLILSAVIMSTVGVLIGLLITAQPFGIVMTGIGVISLAGIVVNNNIVLIDTFDRLKETTGSAREALLRTGAQRLRPVFLTTVTTVLGLLPMVFQTNIDFVNREVTVGAPSTQWWVSFSTAIAFGLTFATLLTLVVTPCALMVRANLSSWRQRRRMSKAEDRRTAAEGRPSRLVDAAE
ncbi:efflux RND transporter permease subunit [Indioceanicola profundi]|uniref:efflux RND transporter permease subunit n=1 Tax=Indioceanicola profundi TaxID=2220096 RepID=UPI000E6ADC6C|nr:efflux RND transporter permease subunit [Indioceanicola profundi]